MRRLGEKLVVHGEKAFSRRPYPPGQHGPKGSPRLSEYGLRLREKQKAQLIYGLLERQFRRYAELAKRRVGNTGEFLMQLLELRLDNVVFRAGFSPSREAARQLVHHGHVTVNGRRITIPSYAVRVGDAISVTEKFRKNDQFQVLAKQLENYGAPAWVHLDKTTYIASVSVLPSLEETATNINPQLIVEFYSR